MDMMDIVEIRAKAALTKSKIPGVEYVINPYIGCGHGCRYCYAAFMSKWSRHHAWSEWGSFVEPKVNIAEVLQGELSRKRKRGTVLLSSACDPYQPVEARFRLTRECILLLDRFGWGINSKSSELSLSVLAGSSLKNSRTKVLRESIPCGQLTMP